MNRRFCVAFPVNGDTFPSEDTDMSKKRKTTRKAKPKAKRASAKAVVLPKDVGGTQNLQFELPVLNSKTGLPAFTLK